MRIGFPGTGTAGRHLRPEVAGPGHEVPPEPGHDGPGHGGARLPAGGRHRGYAAVAPDERRADGLGPPTRRQGASFELPVAADEALAAFHHPYGYAAAQGVAY